MPLEIKDKRTGEVKANGVTGNTICCGHCDKPVLDDVTWIALDDPYFCIIHQSCLGLFNFDRMPRTRSSEGRTRIRVKNDKNVQLLQQMLNRPWWRNKQGTSEYTKALIEILCMHQSLQHSRVIGSGKEE